MVNRRDSGTGRLAVASASSLKVPLGVGRRPPRFTSHPQHRAPEDRAFAVPVTLESCALFKSLGRFLTGTRAGVSIALRALSPPPGAVPVPSALSVSLVPLIYSKGPTVVWDDPWPRSLRLF